MKFRKKQWYFLCLGMLLGLFSMLAVNGSPMAAEAAAETTGKFTIEDGVLLRYQGKQKQVMIPDSVKEIEDKAFYGNKYIENVSMPDSVKELGNKFFMNCENLKKVKFSDAIEEIPYAAFYNCRNLKEFSLPDGLKRIDAKAFYYAGTNLGNRGFRMRLPKRLGSIGESAFRNAGCISLSFEEGCKLRSIARYAFADNCYLSGKVIFPETMDNLGK